MRVASAYNTRAVGPDGDKQPRLLQHARRRIGIEGRIAGVIDEQSIPGRVREAQRHAAAAGASAGTSRKRRCT